MTKTFPNGFLSWAETHHLVVEHITNYMNQEQYSKVLEDIEDSQGMGGIWDFCIQLTDKIEAENENVSIERIEQILNEQL